MIFEPKAIWNCNKTKLVASSFEVNIKKEWIYGKKSKKWIVKNLKTDLMKTLDSLRGDPNSWKENLLYEWTRQIIKFHIKK